MKMEFKDEQLEREINIMIQEIKRASGKSGSNVYDKMASDLSLVNNKNECVRVVCKAYVELKLPINEMYKELEKSIIDVR